jgi:tetratricopeptide (TPR) repeat protein
MAKSKKDEEVVLDVGGAYSKAENYIEENKNSLTVIAVVIILIIGGYFGYTKLYVQPQEEEAQAQVWQAQLLFEQDSFRLAIEGDFNNNIFGFQYIIDEYSVTKSANLAHYYAGIGYLRMGNYNMAIEYLSDFDSDDEILGPMATGAIGDAFMELGDMNQALTYYLEAADRKDNDFTSPMFLKKAGMTYELLNDYNGASEVYEKIKNDYPESDEGKFIEKFLARAQALSI